MKSNALCLLLSIALLQGCVDSDPFGFNKKRITDNYTLLCFPESMRYTVEKKGSDMLGGVFEGNVSRIGWDEKQLFVDVVKNYRGDRDGLYVLEFSNGFVRGPVSEAELASSGVAILPVEVVFKGK